MSPVWHWQQQLRATIPSLLLLCAIGLTLLLILPAYYTASPHHHAYRHRLHPHHSTGEDAIPGGVGAGEQGAGKHDDTHWATKHHHQGRHRHNQAKRLPARPAGDDAGQAPQRLPTLNMQESPSRGAAASPAFPAEVTEPLKAGLPSTPERLGQSTSFPGLEPIDQGMGRVAIADASDDAPPATSSLEVPLNQAPLSPLSSQAINTNANDVAAGLLDPRAGSQGSVPSLPPPQVDDGALSMSTPFPLFVYGGRWAPSKEQATLSTLAAPTPLAYSPSLLPLTRRRLLLAWVGSTLEGAEDASIIVATCQLVSAGSVPGASSLPPQGEGQGQPSAGTACVWSEPAVAAKVHRNVPFAGITTPSMPPKRGGEPHWSPQLFCGDAPLPAGHGSNRSSGGTPSGHDGHSSPPLPPSRECGGPVLLFFKVGWTSARWETFLSRSHDGGASWTPPRPLVKGDVGGRGPTRSKPVWLSDGSILAGGGLDGPLGREGRVHRAFVDRSADGGDTWQRSQEIRPHDKSSGVSAPTLWESKAGAVHLLMGGRRAGAKGKGACMMRADSADYGISWSAPYVTRLPSNGAAPDLARLPSSGVLALAYHPGFAGKAPLRLAVSKDNGKTWPWSVDVETDKGEGADFSDPSLVPWPLEWGGQEGLLLAYSWRKARPVLFSISLEEFGHRAQENDIFCSLR